MEKFIITNDFITLVQFLKTNAYISSGGESKYFIENNKIFLNDIQVHEKRRKIYPNDLLKINDQIIKVESEN